MAEKNNEIVFRTQQAKRLGGEKIISHQTGKMACWQARTRADGFAGWQLAIKLQKINQRARQPDPSMRAHTHIRLIDLVDMQVG